MIVLTDCDGVLLNWEHSFKWFMMQKGYKHINPSSYEMDEAFGVTKAKGSELCQEFNRSAAIGFIPAWKDSVKYVRKLNEERGVVFHVITSMGGDMFAQRLRVENLNRIFGENVFERTIFLDCGAAKTEVLKEYKQFSFHWIEDKPENAEEGLLFGLKPILINQDYNINTAVSPQINRVNTWKEIYQLIVNS